MLKRLIPLAVGLAVAAGLASPVAANAADPPAGPAAIQPLRLTGAAAADAQLAQAIDTLSDPDTTPPPDPDSRYTVSSLRIHLNGYQLGPNAWTDNGMFKIIGWYQDGSKWIRVRSAATCPPCETIGADTAHRPGGAGTTAGAGVTDPAEVTPDGLPDWANPTKWHWKNILGEIWDGIWDACLKGSLVGVGKTASGTLLANLVARGGAVTLGPYGYAAVAIGGCVFSAVR